MTAKILQGTEPGAGLRDLHSLPPGAPLPEAADRRDDDGNTAASVASVASAAVAAAYLSDGAESAVSEGSVVSAAASAVADGLWGGEAGWAETLANVEALRHLESRALDELARHAAPRELRRGERLRAHGGAEGGGDGAPPAPVALTVVVRGEVLAWLPGTEPPPPSPLLRTSSTKRGSRHGDGDGDGVGGARPLRRFGAGSRCSAFLELLDAIGSGNEGEKDAGGGGGNDASSAKGGEVAAAAAAAGGGGDGVVLTAGADCLVLEIGADALRRLAATHRLLAQALVEMVLTRFARLTCGALREYLGLPRSLVPVVRLEVAELESLSAGVRPPSGPGGGGGGRDIPADDDALAAAHRQLSASLGIPPAMLREKGIAAAISIVRLRPSDRLELWRGPPQILMPLSGSLLLCPPPPRLAPDAANGINRVYAGNDDDDGGDDDDDDDDGRARPQDGYYERLRRRHRTSIGGGGGGGDGPCQELSRGEIDGVLSTLTGQPISAAAITPRRRGGGGSESGSGGSGGGSGGGGDAVVIALLLSAAGFRSLCRRHPPLLQRCAARLLVRAPPLLKLLDQCVEWSMLRSGEVLPVAPEPSLAVVLCGRLVVSNKHVGGGGGVDGAAGEDADSTRGATTPHVGAESARQRLSGGAGGGAGGGGAGAGGGGSGGGVNREVHAGGSLGEADVLLSMGVGGAVGGVGGGVGSSGGSGFGMAAGGGGLGGRSGGGGGEAPTVRAVAARDTELLRLTGSVLTGAAALHSALPLAPARRLAGQWQGASALGGGGGGGGGGVGASGGLGGLAGGLGGGGIGTGVACRSVCLLPLGTGEDLGGAVRYLCEALEAALKAMGVASRVLRSHSVHEALGAQAFAPFGELSVVSYLGQLEHHHQLLVYVADGFPSEWTRRCLRQADLALLVSLADGSPAPTPIERMLRDARAPAARELLLLHTRPPYKPQGTRAWLEQRSGIRSHHHVRLHLPGGGVGGEVGAEASADAVTAVASATTVDTAATKAASTCAASTPTLPLVTPATSSAASATTATTAAAAAAAGAGDVLLSGDFDTRHYASDVHRLARSLCGLSFGVVLGGGGARGLAHLGVLRALREEGVPVDLIGGTSQGAFVAGVWAQHDDAYDAIGALSRIRSAVRQFSQSMSSIWSKLQELNFLPFMSYFSGAGFNRLLVAAFGDAKIEDLPTPFFCVTTDLTTSSGFVHRNGSMWRYIRASMTLTGYLPPICDASRDVASGEEMVHLLVDGGYVNNLPADVMTRGLGSDTVIAVDVSSSSAFPSQNFGDSISGLGVLKWRLVRADTRTAPHRTAPHAAALACSHRPTHLRRTPHHQHTARACECAPSTRALHFLSLGVAGTQLGLLSVKPLSPVPTMASISTQLAYVSSEWQASARSCPRPHGLAAHPSRSHHLQPLPSIRAARPHKRHATTPRRHDATAARRRPPG